MPLRSDLPDVGRGCGGVEISLSRRQRHDSFCEQMAFMRWSWMYRRAVSVEWCLQ